MAGKRCGRLVLNIGGRLVLNIGGRLVLNIGGRFASKIRERWGWWEVGQKQMRNGGVSSLPHILRFTCTNSMFTL